jgi:hypothetical protein
MRTSSFIRFQSRYELHNRDLKPGTLHGLLGDIGISAEELSSLR